MKITALKLNNADVNVLILETFHPPSRHIPKSEVDILLKLDCLSGEGLTEKQLLSLLVRCRVCHRYMMRHTIGWHKCAGAPASGESQSTFIDLTGSDD
jgi:hypothetical protein